MTLVQLQYITTLEKCGNFSDAAKECFVTQPTLSMQIQKLEAELGVQLFTRTNQPIKPTEIGSKIIEQARNILRENERIGELIRVEHEEISGKFKVGIITTIAPYLLPLIVESFTKKYTDVELIIDEMQTEQIIEKIKRDELDAAILATPLYTKEISERPVYYEPFVGYISKDHRLYKEKKIDPKKLDVNDLFLLKEGHCFRDHVLQICKHYGDNRKESLRAVNLEGATLETLIKMVDKNIGMTLIPFLAMKEFEGTTKMNSVRKFSDPIPTREISIVYHRSQLKKKLIDLLEEEIKANIPKELLKANHDYVVGIK